MSNAIRLVQRAEPESVTVQEADKAPVVRLTNLIMHDAIAAGASDVHIEPDLRDGQVRVRIDGVMQNYMSIPQPVLDRLVSRLKVMGNMDVSDRLRPHAGRAHIEAHGVASRSAHFNRADQAVREGRRSRAQPREVAVARGSGLAGTRTEAPPPALCLQGRTGRRNRADRVGQDHHALRRVAGARHRQGQCDHRGRPGRVREWRA